MGLRDHYCVWSDSCYINYSNSDTQAPGAHAWDVMATGMYNGQNNPPNYSAFERNCMGWLEYTTLEKDSEVKTLPPLGTSNFAYHAGASKNEWFVFENRQKVKWDAALPNHGLLVWHIDYDYDSWFNNTLNDNPAHQRVDVVEAGNIKVPDYSGGFRAKNFVDDPFPGSQKVTKLERFPAWKNSVSFWKTRSVFCRNELKRAERELQDAQKILSDKKAATTKKYNAKKAEFEQLKKKHPALAKKYADLEKRLHL